MITEYDISKSTEKYPDPWVRLIEYFPLDKHAKVLRMARYSLVKKQYCVLTNNRAAIHCVVSGNFYNDERDFEIRRGGELLFSTKSELDADDYFSDVVLFEELA